MKTAFKVTKLQQDKWVSVYAHGRYQKTYTKGTVVQAEPGTIGILLFKSKHDAQMWANCYLFRPVLEVELLGTVTDIRNVCRTQGEEDLDFWYQDGCPSELSAPYGTIACQKVRVL